MTSASVSRYSLTMSVVMDGGRPIMISAVAGGPAPAVTPNIVGMVERPAACRIARIHLLGPMRATSYLGDDILPRGKKERAMLAYLCLAAGAKVPRIGLARMLWDQASDELARGSLRHALLEICDAMGRLASAQRRCLLDRCRGAARILCARFDAQRPGPVLHRQVARRLRRRQPLVRPLVGAGAGPVQMENEVASIANRAGLAQWQALCDAELARARGNTCASTSAGSQPVACRGSGLRREGCGEGGRKGRGFGFLPEPRHCRRLGAISLVRCCDADLVYLRPFGEFHQRGLSSAQGFGLCHGRPRQPAWAIHRCQCAAARPYRTHPADLERALRVTSRRIAPLE